jgi:hypothetical protein
MTKGKPTKADLQKQIKELQMLIEEKDTRIGAFIEHDTVRCKEIQQLTETLAERNCQIKGKDELIKELREDILTLARELEHRKATALTTQNVHDATDAQLSGTISILKTQLINQLLNPSDLWKNTSTSFVESYVNKFCG